MYFTSGSDRAFEQLMQGKPGFDHYDSGEAVTPEDCGTCRFYRPHWKYQFCIYAECPYQPGKLTAYDAVTFRVKGVENMAVFRVERNKGYTVMSNHHLRNKDLSLKAKGLLSQMLSLPEDWDYTLKGLSLINREQIDAIRAAIRELEQAGYIVRSRERDSQGRLRGADYVIYEQPQPVPDSPTLENPMLDNPTQEKPTLGKPTQLNKDISSKEKSITDVSITDPIPILSRLSPLEDEAAQPPERKGTEAKSQSAILNHFALIIITNTVFPLGNYRTHRRNTVKIRRGAQHEYILVFLQHSLDLALQFLFADVGIVRSVQSCTFTDQCIHLPHIFGLAEVLFHENHGCGSLRYAEPVSHLLRSGTYGHRTQNGPQTAV